MENKYTCPPMHFAVGDEVIWTSYNYKGEPKRYTVTKVGRKLVTIEPYRRPETYRIDNGVRNDDYQHERITPIDVWEYDCRVKDALNVLRNVGLDKTTYLGKAQPTDETILRVAEFVRENLLTSTTCEHIKVLAEDRRKALIARYAHLKAARSLLVAIEYDGPYHTCGFCGDNPHKSYCKLKKVLDYSE
jgi:hypothetical protein